MNLSQMTREELIAQGKQDAEKAQYLLNCTYPNPYIKFPPSIDNIVKLFDEEPDPKTKLIKCATIKKELQEDHVWLGLYDYDEQTDREELIDLQEMLSILYRSYSTLFKISSQMQKEQWLINLAKHDEHAD